MKENKNTIRSEYIKDSTGKLKILTTIKSALPPLVTRGMKNDDNDINTHYSLIWTKEMADGMRQLSADEDLITKVIYDTLGCEYSIEEKI